MEPKEYSLDSATATDVGSGAVVYDSATSRAACRRPVDVAAKSDEGEDPRAAPETTWARRL